MKNRGIQKRLEELMNLSIMAGEFNHCRECGEERSSVQFYQLPKKDKEAFQPLLKFKPFRGNKNQFLYCKKCNLYSIVSGCYL